MKRLVISALILNIWVPVVLAFSPAADAGKNIPVVHSFGGGMYFVRSIPAEDYGSSGKTEMYRVTKDGDELIGEYAVYMWGELFFSWCPDKLEWGIVQLEPVRINHPNEADKLGDVSRLVFYLAGRKIKEYTQEDLADMGLGKRVFAHPHRGDFTVQGIVQVSTSNRYRFTVTKMNENFQPEVIAFDACTGELLDAEPQR